MTQEIYAERHVTVTERITLDDIHPAAVQKVANFQIGQMHRQKGLGCLSANGSYLDGWYAPEQIVPPYVTATELELLRKLELAK